MNFIEWLVKQKDPDNIITFSIAGDVRNDIKDGWKGTTLDSLIRRIYELKGSDIAIERAVESFKLYTETGGV